MEGPRPVRAEELPSLVQLLNHTFRRQRPGNFLDEYPQIFNQQNLRRLIVIAEAGEIVSHVGATARQFAFEDVALSLRLIGGVATAEHCRGRGYATRCLDFAFAQAAQQGDHLAWISGGRGLYTSRGATRAGREWVFSIASGGQEPAGLTIREFASADDFEEAAALYEREPVRFLRTLDDWSSAARSQFVMNRKSRFWSVRRADHLSAYLILHEPSADKPNSLLAEFAGDRADAAAALPAVAARMGAPLVEAHLGEWDHLGREAFGAIAGSSQLDRGRGTFLPLCMAGCMEALRPRIAHYCGEAVASTARFSESGDGPDARSGADATLRISLRCDEACIAGRAEVARFLLGDPEQPAPAFQGAASVFAALAPAFPLPTPWYGLNFV